MNAIATWGGRLLIGFMGAWVSLLPAQTPQLPSYYGGNSRITWDIRQPLTGSWQPVSYPDYVKFTPDQRPRVPDTRQCTTVPVEKSRGLLHPHESTQSFEQWMANEVATQSNKRQTTRGQEIYALPTVVHVIYSSPIENISDEQVFSQIRVLNEDYRRNNPDRDQTPRAFQDRAVDTGIEFCMATQDPAGNPTNGINRVSMAGAPFNENYMNEVVKPRTIWDPTRYVNIWVANLEGGVLGFAQFPESGSIVGLPVASDDAQTDGVVINYTAFGTTGTVLPPFNRGRTATHEMGHWFGLRHIWGDGPCGVDDYCGDTPETGTPTQNCPLSAFGCNGQTAMIQNFMDYTNDACMNLFTYDQRTRMRAVIQNSPRRLSLLNSTACQDVATPPSPAFTANVQMGCAPIKVDFTDQSTGKPTRWAWSFPGGKPSKSSKQNVSVTYKKAGIYPVTLVVSNDGGSRTLTQERYIEVRANGTLLPLSATFEDGPFPPTGFQLFDPDPTHHWEQTPLTSGAGTGTGAMTINNYDNNQLGTVDALLTPIMDISGQDQLILSFDVAYAAYDATYQDTLLVMVATDCETRFEAIYYRGGNDLSTAPPSTQPFAPQPHQWRTEVIDLRTYLGKERLQLAFLNRAGYGNDVFIDNIQLAPSPAEPPKARFTSGETTVCAGNTVAFSDLSLGTPTRWVWSFPGGFPASDTVANPVVRYDEPGSYEVSLTVYNEAGKDVYTETNLIEVSPLPEIRLEASQTSVCAGEAILLSAYGMGPFIWSHDTSLSPSTYQAQVRPTSDQVYQIATTTQQCNAQAEVIVKVRPTTPITIVPAVASICEGESITLNATGARNYEWTPAPSAGLANSGTLRVAPKQTTTYTVTGENTAGCFLEQTVQVEVHEGPTSFFAEADKDLICAGESVILQGRGATGYQWSPSESLNKSEGNQVIAAPPTTTTYIATGFDDKGCSISQQLVIQVDPGPTLEASAKPVVVCPGNEVVLQANGGKDLRWWGDDLLTNDRGKKVSSYPLKTTIYYLAGRSKFGCEDTTSIRVTVRETSPVSISASRQAVCFGESVYLRAEGSLAYTWFVDGRLAEPDPLAERISLTVNQSRKVTLVGTDELGCESRDELVLKLADDRRLPAATFTVDKPVVCVGGEVQFSAKDDDAVRYLWQFPGGTPGVSQERNPVVSFDKPGYQDVILTVTACDGRQNRQEAKGFLTVTQPFTLTLNTDNVRICAGSGYPLEASGALEYKWTPTAGLSQGTGPRVIARPLQSTTYTLTASDGFGCEVTRDIQVEVRGLNQAVGVENIAPVICRGDQVRLSANGGDVYEWTPRSGLDVYDRAEVEASPNQTTTYTVRSIDFDGCVHQDTVTVTIREPGELVLSPGEDVTICEGEQVELSVRGKGIYNWVPALGLNTARGNQVIANPGQTTTYTVMGTDEKGCRGEASLTVNVTPPPSLKAQVNDPIICQGDTTLITVLGSDVVRWSPTEGLDNPTSRLVKAFPSNSTTYTVTSGTGSCLQQQQIAIKVTPAAPLTIAPVSPTICPGESLSLEASGGRNYLWEKAPGLSRVVGSQVQVSPQTTSSYIVRGIDNQGCITQGAVTVKVREPDFLKAVASEATFCDQDEGVRLTLLESTNLRSIKWLPADGLPDYAQGPEVLVRPQFPTVYRVMAQDTFGCLDTAYIPVHVQRPRVNFTASSQRLDLAQSDGKVEFHDLTLGAVSWEWEIGTNSRSTEQHPVHYFSQPGKYQIKLNVSNGVCVGTDTMTIQVINSSDLTELTRSGNIQVDRRPDGVFLISLISPRNMQLEIQLLDQNLQRQLAGVLTLREGNNIQPIDLRDFPKGIYYFEILDAEREERVELVND